MNARTKFHIILGSLVLISGCFLLAFGLENPILGGCITYTNGIARCPLSLNIFPIASGLALTVLGIIEIIYGWKSIGLAKRPVRKPMEKAMEP